MVRVFGGHGAVFWFWGCVWFGRHGLAGAANPWHPAAVAVGAAIFAAVQGSKKSGDDEEERVCGW